MQRTAVGRVRLSSGSMSMLQRARRAAGELRTASSVRSTSRCSGARSCAAKQELRAITPVLALHRQRRGPQYRYPRVLLARQPALRTCSRNANAASRCVRFCVPHGEMRERRPMRFAPLGERERRESGVVAALSEALSRGDRDNAFESRLRRGDRRGPRGPRPGGSSARAARGCADPCRTALGRHSARRRA